MRWNEEVQCHIRALEYDFEARKGRLRLPAMNCTDMEGCIAFFYRIDMGVREIDAISDDGDGVRYARVVGEGWKATRVWYAQVTECEPRGR